jgi:hypothetical protein
MEVSSNIPMEDLKRACSPSIPESLIKLLLFLKIL